jgi:transposase
MLKTVKLIKQCLYCKKDIYLEYCLKFKEIKFCSDRCKELYTPPKQTICRTCGVILKRKNRTKNTTYKYCSAECYKKRKKLSLNEQYEKHVIKREGDKCWGWKGCTNEFGYGLMRHERKCMRAHRVSWEIHKGKIPNKLHVLHYCNNPICSNPNHLFVGTDQDNVDYCKASGRKWSNPNPNKGEKHHNSKITDEKAKKVKLFLKQGNSPRDVATMLNVKIHTVYSIKYNVSWKHVQTED